MISRVPLPALGTATAQTNVTWTANSAGLSFNAAGYAGTGTTFNGTNVSASITQDSIGLRLDLSVPAGNGGFLSAGGQTASLGTAVFSNSNGISFGINGQTVTAAHNALTSQSNQAFSAQGGSSAFQTLGFSNQNGVTFTNTNGSVGITHDLQHTSATSAITSNAIHSSASRVLNVVAATNNTGGGAASLSSNVSFSNANGATFYTSAGNAVALSYTVPNTAGLLSAVNVSAGTTNTNASNFAFSDSNGVSFGLDGRTITGSVATTYRASNDAVGLNTALTAGPLAWTVNSAGVSLNAGSAAGTSSGFAGNSISGSITHDTAGINISLNHPAWLTTAMASNAATLSNLRVSAGTTSNLLSAVTFADGNGISFGINASTITASHNALTTAAQSDHSHGNPTLALTNLSGTTASNSAGFTLSLSASTGGGNTGFLSAGANTASLGTVIFSNANGLTFGLDGQTLTASHNAVTTARASNDAVGLNTAQTNVTWTVNSAGLSLNAGGYAGTGFTSTTTGGTAIVGTLNTVGLSLGVPAYLTTAAAQSNQTGGVYALGNTTGQSSSSTYDLRTLSVDGGGIVSVGWSNSTLRVSATQSGQAFSADASSTFQTLSFQDSNGVSFSNNAGALRITHGLQHTSATSAITSNALHSSSPRVFNILAATNNTGGGTASLSSDVSFGNANGVTFYTSAGGIVVASYTVPSVPSSYVSQLNGSSGAVSLNVGSSLSSSTNGSSITFGLASDITTALQSAGNYLTTARASNDAVGLNTALTAGPLAWTVNSSGISLNAASAAGTSSGFAGNSISGSITHNTAGINVSLNHPAWLTTAMQSNAATISNINLSAGTTSTNASAFTLANANGISFGLGTGASAGSITASHNGLTTARASNDAIGLNTALTAGPLSWTVNSSGLSVNAGGVAGTSSGFAGNSISGSITHNTAGINISLNHPAWLTTAMQSNAVTISNLRVSAGTTSNLLSAVTFADGNGISFGINASTVTASHNALTTARASNDAVGLNTAQTNVTWTVNSAGLSLNAGGYAGTGFTSTTTAGTAVVATNNTAGLSVGVPAFLTTAMASNRGSDFVQANAGFNGTNASGTIASNAISVSVAAQTVQTQNLHNVTLSGNTAGVMAQVSSGTLTLAGGNNITLSQDGNAITISGANVGGAQTAISGIVVSDATYTSGTVSFSNAGNITIGSSVDGATQYIRLSGNAPQTTQSAIRAFGVSNTGATAGNTGVSTGVDWVLAGSNSITLSQSTAVGGPNTVWVQHPAWLTTAMASNRGSDFVQATAAFAGTNASGTIASNGVSVSVGNYLTTAMQSNAATISNIRVSGGTTSNLLSAITFANGNGISFGLDASTLTASHNGLTSQSNQNVTAANGGFAFQTLSFSNVNGISFGTSAGSAITASHNAITTARASNDAIGLNTAQTNVTWTVNSAGLSLNAAGYAGTGTSNTGAASFTLNSNGLAFNGSSLAGVGTTFNGTNASGSMTMNTAGLRLDISVNPGGGGAAISAGANSQSTGTVNFANSNGITFGLSNNGTLTASHNGLTTARASNDAIGLNTALTAGPLAWTVNSSGLSLNAGSAAGTSSGFTGANISVSMTHNTAGLALSASVAAPGAASENNAIHLLGANTSGNTTATGSTIGWSGINLTLSGTNNSQVAISAPATSSLSATGPFSISTNGATISMGVANMRLYASSNTFGTSSGTADLRTLSIAGSGAVSVAASNSGWVISAPVGVGLNTAQTNVTWTVNSSGISLNAAGYAGTGTSNTGAASFTLNSNGLAFNGSNLAGTGTTFNGANISASMTLNSNGLNLSASVAAPGAAAENNWIHLLGVNTSGNTTVSGSTVGLSGVNLTLSGTNNSQLVISAPATSLLTVTGVLSVSSDANTVSLGVGPMPAYAVGNTTQSSSGTWDARSLSFAASGALAVGVSNGSVLLSGRAPGLNTAQTNVTWTVNSSGISLNAAGYAGTGTTFNGANISASMTLNSNGLNLSASVAAPGAAAESNAIQLLGANTSGNTTATGSTIGWSGVNLTLSGTNNSQVVISAPAVSSLSATGVLSISTNGSTISMGVGPMSAYAVGNTTQSSSGTWDARSLSFAGSGNVSVGVSNGSVIVSGGEVKSYFRYLENWAGMVTGASAITQTSGSSVFVQPFWMPYPVSASYLRLLASFNDNAVGTAGTTSANTTFSVERYTTVAAVVYTQGVGANSLSLQSIYSTSVGITGRTIYSAGAQGSQYTMTLQKTYPATGAVNNGYTTSYAVSLSQIALSSQSNTLFTGPRFLDVPFETSLGVGPYWLGIGARTSSASNSSNISAFGTAGMGLSLAGVSQSNVSVGILGAVTSASAHQLARGLGAFTTNAAIISTASIGLGQISQMASNRQLPFELIREA